MRVISLVPSWTETLIEAGVEVVGRTRFCVHPAERVASIPIVGGTKDIDWARVRDLGADLLVLDREENPRAFADEAPIPWIATHVMDVASAAEGLRLLADRIRNAELRAFADRYASVALATAREPGRGPGRGIGHALLRSWPAGLPSHDPVIYVIWRKPWMAAGSATYIGSVLRRLGFGLAELPEGKYPVISEELLRVAFPLFSSEPFPFLKKEKELRRDFPRGAIADGEALSWFGVRGLRFLEECLSAGT